MKLSRKRLPLTISLKQTSKTKYPKKTLWTISVNKKPCHHSLSIIPFKRQASRMIRRSNKIQLPKKETDWLSWSKSWKVKLRSSSETRRWSFLNAMTSISTERRLKDFTWLLTLEIKFKKPQKSSTSSQPRSLQRTLESRLKSWKLKENRTKLWRIKRIKRSMRRIEMPCASCMRNSAVKSMEEALTQLALRSSVQSNLCLILARIPLKQIRTWRWHSRW